MAEVGEGTPGGHGRRVRARRPRPALRGELEAWAEPVSMALDGRVQELVGWPGLFAHGHLDPGTELLLAHLPDLRGASVLDFACGAGVIARVAAERGAARVDASDHDALAIHATRRNAPAATTWCVEGLPPGAWDRILSNPPLHRGVEQDYGALEGFAAALPRALRPGGAAWLVAQATVPIRRIFAGFTVAKVGADARYVVWRVAR
jgi:16S rRNA (guanine1207-N2)-methyltransferase